LCTEHALRAARDNDTSREAKSVLDSLAQSGRPRWAAFLVLSALPVLVTANLVGCRGRSPATSSTRHGKSATGSTPVSNSSVAFPLTLTDDKGKRWTFDKPARRIVSLAPSVTELLFAIGAGDKVVGVTNYCDYPPEAKGKEKIGGFKDPSQEQVVSLNPDAVIASRGTPDPIIEELSATGMKVFCVDHEDIRRMLASFSSVGKIAACSHRAEKVRKQLAGRWDAVLAKTRPLKPAQRPRLLYVVWAEPLFTAGPGSYANELIEASGAVNIAADAESDWPQYSLEAAIAKDPQVLLLAAGPMSGFDVIREKKLAELKADKRWRNVSAVKDGRLIVLDEDHLGVPGPRLIDGLKELASALHPDLFRKSPQ